MVHGAHVSLWLLAPVKLTGLSLMFEGTLHATTSATSQRSLHNAPIFRLLLKVAVNGTHQCDFLNF